MPESVPTPSVVQGQFRIPAEYGDRVKFAVHIRTATDGKVRLEGEGVFTLAWLGIEEVWDVHTDDGHIVHVYPVFGDTMEKVTDAKEG